MRPLPGTPTEVIPPVPGPPGRRRTVRWLAAAVVAAALAAGSVVVLGRHRAAVEPTAPATARVATVRLERRDLSTTRSLPGSIGYGAARPLAGHTEATVTWLPSAGATVERGRQLFRADDEPVVLFYGDMPLYRRIAGPGLVGRDVRIVADNLEALGYRPGRRRPARTTRAASATPAPTAAQTPAAKAPGNSSAPAARAPAASPAPRPGKGEAVLTAGLTAAIQDWQRALGRPVTGQIAVGDVEVLPGPVRVDSLSVQPGSPANAPLMSVTPTRKVITVPAELADAASVRRGGRVSVTLPDDRTVHGRVVAVGRDLVTAEGSPDGGSPKLTVTVRVDDPRTVARLDSADVEVHFPGRTARQVLAAPIEALVALTEGGYAVQGPNGLVAVRTGMFADGWVEVTGEGLTEGMAVVVAS